MLQITYGNTAAECVDDSHNFVRGRIDDTDRISRVIVLLTNPHLTYQRAFIPN